MGEAIIAGGGRSSGNGGVGVYKRFYQAFSTNTQFTVPECRGQVINVMCFGGGGGGGWSIGGGGGGGNMTMKDVTVGAGTIVQISIGAGGNPGYYDRTNNTYYNSGYAGGTTSFGIYASATGGGGGNNGNGGAGGSGGGANYRHNKNSGRGYLFGGGGGGYYSSDSSTTYAFPGNGGKWGGGGGGYRYGNQGFGGGFKWNNVVVETIVGPANEQRWVNNFNVTWARINRYNGNTGWNNTLKWFNVTAGNSADVIWYNYEKQSPCGDGGFCNNGIDYNAADGINTIGWTNVYFDPIGNKYCRGYGKGGGNNGGGGGFGGNGGIALAGNGAGGGGYAGAGGNNAGGGGGGFGNDGYSNMVGGGGGGYGPTGYGHGGNSNKAGTSGIVVISYEQLVFE